ncbi:DUF1304 domain-containing protein [Chitinophaga sedimenti]|uniref:DUF1304 domain-containing protein n=1 Tax=Chitinophaga sedimenti TaxID=2033606 RepID=UPI00249EDDB5|nr:DUF1304 domain-containing protein [Chitinophaga sedimenti]
MAGNQGLYNGFLAAGLIWSFFIDDEAWAMNIRFFFLGCVAVAGIYGAATASKRIFFRTGIAGNYCNRCRYNYTLQRVSLLQVDNRH